MCFIHNRVHDKCNILYDYNYKIVCNRFDG